MARKRVYPLARASDGSAFTKCELCGVSVPMALADMHDCEEVKVKRTRVTADVRRGFPEKSNVKKKKLLTIEKGAMEIPADFKDQPRSPFCFFMEEFVQSFEGEILIEVSQSGFEAWRNMSFGERYEYILMASNVNSPFEKKIQQEEIDEIEKKIDEEASSSSRNVCQCCDCQHYEDLSESCSYSRSCSYSSYG